MGLREDVERALDGVNPSAPSTTQLKPVAAVLGTALGFPDSAYAISVSQAGNLIKQADQSLRAQTAKLLIVCLRDDQLLDAVARAIPKRIGPGRLEAVLVVVLGSQPRLAALLEPEGGGVKSRLDRLWPGVPWRDIPALWNGNALAPTAATVPLHTSVSATDDDGPLILDPVIKRMLRLAIASYRAVLLVGPPGTGKTTLLEEATREARLYPDAYGLANPPTGLRVTTPEENWTARELIGGETVDDKGRLRFTPGHVLRAIADDEWLVLDEANRADLDRIFGALLTWLSGKDVIVGVASGDPDGAQVRLEWGGEPRCATQGLERLESGTGEPIRYVAGSDWRLLGTYNAVDAQRVFRLGQALGRRFVRIPVPPIDRKQFLQALQPRLEALPESFDSGPLEEALVGLYTMHVELYPPLGPAVFLAVPQYVAGGLALREPIAEEADEDLPEPSMEAELGHVAIPAGPAAQAGGHPLTARAHHLLAEAYLLGAGVTLAALDDQELEQIRARVVDDEGLLAPGQWAFIASMLPALG